MINEREREIVHNLMKTNLGEARINKRMRKRRGKNRLKSTGKFDISICLEFLRLKGKIITVSLLVSRSFITQRERERERERETSLRDCKKNIYILSLSFYHFIQMEMSIKAVLPLHLNS